MYVRMRRTPNYDHSDHLVMMGALVALPIAFLVYHRLRPEASVAAGLLQDTPSAQPPRGAFMQAITGARVGGEERLGSLARRLLGHAHHD